MKMRFVHILICATLSSVAIATEFNIPGQELGTSLQDLARQSGTQIVFRSRIVEGRAAAPVRGDVSIDTALAVLLDGTALTYRRLDTRTIQIEIGAEQVSLPPVSMQYASMDEFEVSGGDSSPGELRSALIDVEGKFIREYNRRNGDHQFDLVCRTEPRIGSLIGRRTCQAVFVQRAYEIKFSCDFALTGYATERHPDGTVGSSTTDVTACTGERFVDPGVLIMQKLPTYQKNMMELVRQNPELRDLLMERTRLARELAAARKR